MSSIELRFGFQIPQQETIEKKPYEILNKKTGKKETRTRTKKTYSIPDHLSFGLSKFKQIQIGIYECVLTGFQVFYRVDNYNHVVELYYPVTYYNLSGKETSFPIESLDEDIEAKVKIALSIFNVEPYYYLSGYDEDDCPNCNPWEHKL